MPKGLELKGRVFFTAPQGRRAIKGTFGLIGNKKKQQTIMQIVEKNKKQIILDGLAEEMKTILNEKKE